MPHIATTGLNFSEHDELRIEAGEPVPEELVEEWMIEDGSVCYFETAELKVLSALSADERAALAALTDDELAALAEASKAKAPKPEHPHTTRTPPKADKSEKAGS